MGFGSGFSSKGGGLKVVSGSEGQILRFHSGGKRVVGTDELTFKAGEGFNVSGNIQHSGNIEPEVDNSWNLGRSGKGYVNVSMENVVAGNVYAGDLHMKNERGDWTIFEEKTSLIVQNNLTGERFKLVMEKVKD